MGLPCEAEIDGVYVQVAVRHRKRHGYYYVSTLGTLQLVTAQYRHALLFRGVTGNSRITPQSKALSCLVSDCY